MEPTTEVLDFEEMFLDDADTMAIEEEDKDTEAKEAKDTPVRRDNRDLKDENSSQKLKKEGSEILPGTSLSDRSRNRSPASTDGGVKSRGESESTQRGSKVSLVNKMQLL